MLNSPALELGLTILNRLRGEVAEKPISQPDYSSLDIRVREYLNSFPPLPEYSLLLGVCEDGMPLLLDLENADPGPILVYGSNPAETHQMLYTMMNSILYLNSHQQVRIAAMCTDTLPWSKLIDSDHGISCYFWAEDDVENLIYDLVGVLEARRHGYQTGPAVVIAAEDLDKASTLNHKAQANLRWILRYGPEYQIWTLASMNPDNSQNVPVWSKYFQTVINGQLDDPFQSLRQTNQPVKGFEKVETPETYQMYLSNSWQKISLPYYL